VTLNLIDFHKEVANPYNYSCYNRAYSSEAYISIMWGFHQAPSKLPVGSATDSGGNDNNTATYAYTLVGATSLRSFIEGGLNATSTAVASEPERLFQNITLSMLSSDEFV
jgi:hypothetical protein